MAAALGLLVLGLTLVYSAIKGLTIAEVFQGATGDPLNPKGGVAKKFSGSPSTGNEPEPDATGSSGGPFGSGSLSGNGQFKGPNAEKLEALRKIAVSKYNLRVSQICRPANATYGAANSLHKSCRAMDLTGSVADKVAFARYAKSLSWVDEVFCDQAGMVAPGFAHGDHVHVGA